MRWTRTLIPTLRQVPTEAVVPSHRLMLRAGLIQQVAAGSYTYLPLGYRVLRKVMQIVREEMDRAGAVELFMPTLQPVELWEQTGRRAAYGENLFVVRDRHGRELALGPTHEEVVTDLIKRSVHSYRDLPLTVYQIQTKFRDEFRPRFGVLRSREFQMKDAYSFDLTVEGLDRSYDAMFNAYCRIFERCGLHYVTVEAESGPIGGSASHEFMIPSPTGEDTILSSDKGNYAANVEKCETGDRPYDEKGEPTGDLEVIHTPDCPGIDDVVTFFKKQLKTKLKPENMLKTLVCRREDGGWVVAVVRGDHELNEAKLRDAVGAEVSLADDGEAKEAGFAIGFVGPHIAAKRKNITLVADYDAVQPGFWVTGANKVDHHVRHFNWQRDVLAAGRMRAMQFLKAMVEARPGSETAEGEFRLGQDLKIADIRNALAGDPSPKNDGGTLQEAKGIEVGHVFKLGAKYAQALNLTVLDENQNERHPIMGCYGIGVNRIIAAAIEAEAGHDDGGIIWPAAIAPYHVLITPIKYEGEMRAAADRLYEELHQAGVEVLLDDRAERPGVKFKDADLVGIPLRITIGDKGLAEGCVEFKPRDAARAEMVPLGEVVEQAVRLIPG